MKGRKQTGGFLLPAIVEQDITNMGNNMGNNMKHRSAPECTYNNPPEPDPMVAQLDLIHEDIDFEYLSSFPRLPYRPEVDGLRAIAIIPVVLFHFECGFPGGFAGVDVFFVISGFLISCIVLHELAKGKFSMKNFWFRRVRRLFPALVFLLVPLLIVGWQV